MPQGLHSSQFTVVVQIKQQHQHMYVTVDSCASSGVHTNACPECGACHLN